MLPARGEPGDGGHQRRSGCLSVRMLRWNAARQEGRAAGSICSSSRSRRGPEKRFESLHFRSPSARILGGRLSINPLPTHSLSLPKSQRFAGSRELPETIQIQARRVHNIVISELGMRTVSAHGAGYQPGEGAIRLNLKG